MDNGASSYRRFLDGDDNGLEDIVRDYKDGLILYLNGFVNNIYIAEDLMEETLFKLIIKKPRFNEKYSFKTWLYRIGHNVAIDYIRHNSKYKISSLDNLENIVADEYNLERTYIKKENKIIIHNALKKINSEYHQILWLLYFEEFTNKDIESIMRKNSRQITNLLYRAKKSLKEELQKEGFDYEKL